MSKRIARAMMQALGCDGIYVTQASGKAAGQDVFYYHMHLYPRWRSGKAIKMQGQSREATAKALRAALDDPTG